jgi:hypothetical protein
MHSSTCNYNKLARYQATAPYKSTHFSACCPIELSTALPLSVSITIDTVNDRGRTAIVYRIKNSFVCKILQSLRSKILVNKINNTFVVEKQLLERLEDYPRLI